MGLFSNLSANRKIIKRLEIIEADLESLPKLARDLRALDLEFSTLFGKVRTMMGRIEKRAAIIESSEEPEEALEALPGPGASDGIALTPSQIAWQRKILRERGRGA